MTTLGDLARSRDNNFNLIRMLAATAVLVSHAWLIAMGRDAVQPMQIATGHSLGTLSVFLFFSVSGFFITASFDRALNPTDFLRARALRLFPAAAVSMVLVALILGPNVTTLPLETYFGQRAPWEFILRNATLISLKFDLPGVFATQPHPMVESSIWTLPNELACYGAVFAVGLLGLLRRKTAFTAGLFAYFLLWMIPELGHFTLPPRVEALRVLSLPFAIGMGLYIWRHQIPIVGKTALGLLLGLLALTVLLHATPAYNPLLILFIGYGSFWLAYLPGGALRHYNRLGDYSYGCYLYAWPIQGAMIWAFGPMEPWANVALALPPTLILAVVSWHYVEAPALALRRGRAS